VDARKQRFDEDDLEQLFAGASRIVAARGKKSVELDLAKDPPSREELARAVLGPSGNLRAPALRMGTTWLIGFGQPAWDDWFGPG